ncbi:hypothetical protein Tco_1372157, partial [Tanacetum coccineum]
EIDRKINESVKEVVISSVKHAMRAPHRALFKDLPTSDMKEILLQRMLEENYNKGHAATDQLEAELASALKSTYAPPPENSLLAQTRDMAIFMDWYCKRQGITHLTLQDLEGPAFEIVKVFHPNVIHLQFQMEECHKLLTDQVDDTILRYNGTDI